MINNNNKNVVFNMHSALAKQRETETERDRESEMDSGEGIITTTTSGTNLTNVFKVKDKVNVIETNMSISLCHA